ncbi:MAG: twin-arginine translocase TatA/TatE family subunit [Thermoleophilia bacterium]
MDFSPVQMLMVLVIALIVFGPKRLPEMARNLGQGRQRVQVGHLLGDDGPTSRPRAPRRPPAVTAPAAPAAPATASGDV